LEVLAGGMREERGGRPLEANVDGARRSAFASFFGSGDAGGSSRIKESDTFSSAIADTSAIGITRVGIERDSRNRRADFA